MSTALAIASVTQVLKDLLNNGLIDHDVTGAIGGNVTVSALPPDRIDTGETKESSQLNLFMYQATFNSGWRNQGLPSHNSRGERIQNPPLALDLHYLLTAYGSAELHHEILLGYGMQLLHETPVLVRDAIRRSLALPTTVNGTGLPANLTALSTSELAEQIEQIKITPETMNTEEMSRLWTAFGAKYRPNAAYRVTVVLIESRKSAKTALPVQERIIYVIPFKGATIEKISSKATLNAVVVENQKILSGYFLLISGGELKGEIVTVNINGSEIVPAATDITDTQITIQLPNNLQSGIHGVQVIHKIAMGSPPLPHQSASSNVQAFVLSPSIIEPINVENPQGSGNALRSADIKLTVDPAIKETQRIILLLNEFQAPAGEIPMAYSFPAPVITPHNPPLLLNDITIPVSGVKAGIYLVRIQVDGAESPLQVDAAFNYNAPRVTMP